MKALKIAAIFLFGSVAYWSGVFALWSAVLYQTDGLLVYSLVFAASGWVFWRGFRWLR